MTRRELLQLGGALAVAPSLPLPPHVFRWAVTPPGGWTQRLATTAAEASFLVTATGAWVLESAPEAGQALAGLIIELPAKT